MSTETRGDLLAMAGMIVAFSGHDPTGDIARACYDAADDAFGLERQGRLPVNKCGVCKEPITDERPGHYVEYNGYCHDDHCATPARCMDPHECPEEHGTVQDG